MKVAIVVGTRPQIIKSAPVYDALVREGTPCEIINTGQHYDYEMNKEFFSELKLPDPAADLDVGKGSPSSQVGQIVSRLGDRFEENPPDLAVVPGDTNSALAGAIACSKSGVPAAHLESGCRSNDMRMAEEVNRRVVDHISDVLFCPTKDCLSNVKAEHVGADLVENVGDTMLDSVIKFEESFDRSDVAERNGLNPSGYAFMTLHRAENVDDARTLGNILAGVGSLGVQVGFSVHPRTRSRLSEFQLKVPPSIKLLDPIPYLDTLALVKNSSIVVTDSGGLQKEAFWLGRPSLITRDRTEWMEIVRAGGAVLVGSNARTIQDGMKKLLKAGRKPFEKSRQTFGGGRAAGREAALTDKYISNG
jgi:UDP-GlcNAc3NAcA epimerase